MRGVVSPGVDPVPSDPRPGDEPVGDLDAEARARAIRLLGTREHSRRELARKLGARGYAPDVIDRVLDRLAADGLLDEQRLVEVYVAERFGKGFGPLRVRLELREKGLSDEQIESHLSLDDERCLTLLAAAHTKRFGSGRPRDAHERAKRGRFLEYRGFPPRLIARFFDTDD